jgi:hypothetical protein
MARNDKAHPPKLKLDGLEILARHDHEFSGARLILARTAQGEEASAFIAAWAAPWQKTIADYRSFANEAEARAAFDEMRKEKPPATPSLTRDFQRSAVYAWEERHIDPTNMPMTPEQMERVIQRISRDFAIDVPKFKYREPRSRDGAVSSYQPGAHAIEMQHKKLSYVLHEAAHAIDIAGNGNVWAHHGPSFVRTLIRLADTYQFWHSAEELEQSARAAGIKIAPDSAVPKLPRPKAP